MDFATVRSVMSPVFHGKGGGIDGWLQEPVKRIVKDHLCALDENSMSHSELDQLLLLSNIAGITQGFFQFYWIKPSPAHPHRANVDTNFDSSWSATEEIVSLEHFKYGWTRFYIDALMYFGDVERAFRNLADKTYEQLIDFFAVFSVDTEAMESRGRRVLVEPIPQDHRYLIAELACKNLEEGQAINDLKVAYLALDSYGRRPHSIKALVDQVEKMRSPRPVSKGQAGPQTPDVKSRLKTSTPGLQYVLEDFMDVEVSGTQNIDEALDGLTRSFREAREKAMNNTELYLSMARELDVYVATSMRTRENFRDMARFCDIVFQGPAMKALNVRYFDPTLSAASGHEDKGLIECLMVKSATALVYSASKTDSFGKDAEAAMALSLGKPVIFFCDDATRREIFDSVHPLSRLISFDRGVAVGAMIVSTEQDVERILERIFTNRMVYRLENKQDDRHLRLIEEVSGSTVRLQSHDPVLRNALRVAYHGIDRD